METEDHKKYNILENILQCVNRNYVALPADETNRNNQALQIIDRIVDSIKSKSTLFKNLYRNKFYGGSFYDGLKVGKPCEYDLDCLLSLPKIVEPTVVPSKKPGYVHIVLKNMEALKKNPVEAPKFAELERLLDGNSLSTKKVRSWMEGLMTAAVSVNTVTDINIEGTSCAIKYKVAKSGPAFTIKVEGEYKGTTFNLDVDLVPCFVFSDQWPKQDYRPNPCPTKPNFLVVPKSPSEDLPLYWRLSFQEQEKFLMHRCSIMKPAIKLIKKIRDRHQHFIASYYIKTVFLLERDNMDEGFWSKSLSYVFATMLKKYAEYLDRKNIPYYWNKRNNLLAELSDDAVYCIAQKIKKITEHMDRICNTPSKTDIYGIVQYFLTKEEHDLETFKQEAPLHKKLLKQLEGEANSPPEPKSLGSHVARPSVSPESSSSSFVSSFEEIGKDECEPTPGVLPFFLKLENLCLRLESQQMRMFSLLEGVMEKVENCERQIKGLRDEMVASGRGLKMEEEVHDLVDLTVKIEDPECAVKRPKIEDGLETSGDLLEMKRSGLEEVVLEPQKEKELNLGDVTVVKTEITENQVKQLSNEEVRENFGDLLEDAQLDLNL